jgi:serine/threonine-protein kinase HipA
MVVGEGKNPSVEHLTKLGAEAQLPKANVKEIIDQTKSALSGWSKLAKKYGVSAASIKLISGQIEERG